VWWTKVGVVLLEQEETENNWTRHGHYKMLPEILRLRFKRGGGNSEKARGKETPKISIHDQIFPFHSLRWAKAVQPPKTGQIQKFRNENTEGGPGTPSACFMNV